MQNYKTCKEYTKSNLKYGGENNHFKLTRQMTILKELLNEYIKMIIITILHIFKKVQTRWNIASRDMENIKSFNLKFLYWKIQ